MNEKRRKYAELWHEAQQIPIGAFFASDPTRMAGNVAEDAATMSPGYVGKDYKAGGWLFVGNFPGGGGDAYAGNRASSDDALYSALRALASATTSTELVRRFDAVAEVWIDAQKDHRLYANVMRPALAAGKKHDHEVAFLNTFPFRCQGNRPPTTAMRRFAWDQVVAKQIAALNPGTIIALGKAAGGVLRRYYDGPARLVVLPRAIGDTRLTAEARDEITRLAAAGQSPAEVSADSVDQVSSMRENAPQPDVSLHRTAPNTRGRQKPYRPHTVVEAVNRPPASFGYQPIHDFWHELKRLGPTSVEDFHGHMRDIGWKRPSGQDLTYEVARTDLASMCKHGFARRLDG